MANPYRELKRLMSTQQQAITGEVIAVSANVLDVTTRSGAIKVRIESTDVTRYRAGDTVRIVNDTVRGKVARNTDIYVL